MTHATFTKQVSLVFIKLVSFSFTVMISKPSFAQSAPGWSRGQQILAITYEGCVARASQALTNEGYRIDYSQGSFAVGIKNVHTAIIMCNPAPDGTTVNIVVASNGEGGGLERQHLQAQMENPQTTAGKGFFGNWTYYDISSGFTAAQTFDSNGNGSSPEGVTSKYSFEGNELVIKWSNGWVNRYTLPIHSPMSGVALGPSGEKHNITLTRR